MMAAMRTQGMLVRRGLVLEYATLAWNVSAPRSSSSLRLPRSVAPADVGVDALIEIVASAAVVVCQLQENRGPGSRAWSATHTRTLPPVLAVLGSMAVEGPVIEWVATHRKQHRFSDHMPGYAGAAPGATHRRASPGLRRDEVLAWRTLR